MKKRIGLTGALSAIALSVAMASAVTPALAQQDAGQQVASIDVDALCALILGTTSVAGFEAIPEAVAALKDPANPCFAVAVQHYVELSDAEERPVTPEIVAIYHEIYKKLGYDFDV